MIRIPLAAVLIGATVMPGPPTPTGFVSIAAGETWNFQALHRGSISVLRSSASDRLAEHEVGGDVAPLDVTVESGA